MTFGSFLTPKRLRERSTAMWNHNTSECIKLKDAIQTWINTGRLEMNNEKTSWVDIDPFPTIAVVELVQTTSSSKASAKTPVKPKFQEYTYNARWAHVIPDTLIAEEVVFIPWGAVPPNEETIKLEPIVSFIMCGLTKLQLVCSVKGPDSAMGQRGPDFL